MNKYTISNIRDCLNRRKDKLDSCSNHEFYYSYLNKYYGYIAQVPLLVKIVNDLETKFSDMEVDADLIVERKSKKTYDNEMECAAISNFVVKKSIIKKDPKIAREIGKNYIQYRNYKLDSAMDFNKLFVEPLHDYLVEQLEERIKEKERWENLRLKIFDFVSEYKGIIIVILLIIAAIYLLGYEFRDIIESYIRKILGLE